MESLEGSGRVMGGQQSLLLKHDQVLPLLVGARSKVESDHHRCVASAIPTRTSNASVVAQAAVPTRSRPLRGEEHPGGGLACVAYADAQCTRSSARFVPHAATESNCLLERRPQPHPPSSLAVALAEECEARGGTGLPWRALSARGRWLC
jgi:hypothetical protein